MAKLALRGGRVALKLRHPRPQRRDLLGVVAGPAAGPGPLSLFPELLALDLQLGDSLLKHGRFLPVAGTLLAADLAQGTAEAGDQLAHTLHAGALALALLELLLELGNAGITLIDLLGVRPGVEGGELLGQALDLLALPLEHLRAGAVRRGCGRLRFRLAARVQRIL
ncbi:MAG: hypothetical protein ACYSUA_11120 [Planctomycetota bacterium]